MCRPARTMRGRSSRSSIQRVSDGESASRNNRVPPSRSATACFSLVASSTAPWASSPTCACASTKPGRTQPCTVWTSAPADGAAYVILPPTTQSSSRTSCGPTSTLPLMWSTGAVMSATLPMRRAGCGAGACQRARSPVVGQMSSILRVGLDEAEPLPLVPLASLVAVCRDATRPLDHLRRVHEVPGHEGRVAVGEIILGTARALVEIGRAGSDVPDPSRVGLRRDDVAQVLKAVEDVHGAVLDTVLVACDQRATDPAIEGVLTVFVELTRLCVETLDDLLGLAGVVAEPDRTSNNKDVGSLDPLPDDRRLVGGPPVLGHVGIDAGRDVMVDRPEHLDLNPLAAHQRGAHLDQPLGVGDLRRALQRAVEEHRPETSEVPVLLSVSHGVDASDQHASAKAVFCRWGWGVGAAAHERQSVDE